LGWVLNNEILEGTPAYDRQGSISLSLSDELGE